MAPTCLFCPQKATTREHALPEWIANRFGLRGVFLYTYTEGGNVFRKQPISVKSMRRLMLCEPCQIHCKHLEDRTIPILERMGNGESLTLTGADQDILAEWGAKTAYAIFGFLRSEAVIPIDHRYIVRQRGLPARHVFVAFGSYDGPVDVFASAFPIEDEAGVKRDAYNAVAAFGKVILKVFSVIEPSPHDTYRIPVHRAIQVWPPWKTPVEWPLPISINGNNLDMRDFIGWVPVVSHPSASTEITHYPGL